MTQLGHVLMEGIAMSLGLDASYFADRYTREPLTLFRIFNYPYEPAAMEEPPWGVGEHTDYGLLTILKQDDAGGLEVKSPDGWIPAPPVPNSFVCNIGDMLDRMTAGQYRSTAHRVRNLAARDRLEPAHARGAVELDEPELVREVRQCERGHPVRHRCVHRVVDAHRAVGDRVFAVQPQMDEAGRRHGDADCRMRAARCETAREDALRAGLLEF